MLQQAPTEVPPLVPVVLLTAVSEAAEDVKLEVEVEPVDSLQRNIVFVEELPQVVVVGLPLSLSLPLPLINAACLNTESARSGPPSALSA